MGSKIPLSPYFFDFSDFFTDFFLLPVLKTLTDDFSLLFTSVWVVIKSDNFGLEFVLLSPFSYLSILFGVVSLFGVLAVNRTCSELLSSSAYNTVSS